MHIATSQKLFEQAKKVIPGGVNSPVRAFKAVGGNPLFIGKAKGAYLYDEDGNSFIEFINSWGPMILGHAFEPVEAALTEAIKGSLSFGAPGRKEVEIAELIVDMVPGIEKVRMVNSGTEATMSVIRLARGYTGREKIIKFQGCYHGHGDSFLIAAGSGAVTFGTPDSPGVTQGVAQDTLTAPYNDLASVKALFEANEGDVACVILEPVVGNMGCVLPDEGFLQGLKTLCQEKGALLIFDEVMTGFRLAPGGAQERLGVEADLVTFGKIIGGGMPVGAYAGKQEVMDYVSPAGPVYQAGTLSGNPIAMTSGIVTLKYLKEHPEVYEAIDETTAALVAGTKANLKELGLNYTLNTIGSMWTLFFNADHVTNFEGAQACDMELFGKYFRAMLEQGIYLAPSQYESLFVSVSITEDHVGQFLEAQRNALKVIHETVQS